MTVKDKEKQEAEQPDQTEPSEAGAAAPEGPTDSAESTESTASTESTSSTEPAPDWQDRYLRLAAEFDNFRKRTAREFGDLVRTAERDLIAELTEVLDNLARAVDADHKGESMEDFARGVALIRDQLSKALAKRGLEKMDSVGQPFDPNAHDALLRMPSAEHAEGIVIQEVTPGYRLGDKILRHAKVIVSQGAPPEESAQRGSENE
ncbi:MAG: nucleotide exchange factor GrpE [Candidatus Zixiibacteriota bacterium]